MRRPSKIIITATAEDEAEIYTASTTGYTKHDDTTISSDELAEVLDKATEDERAFVCVHSRHNVVIH